MSSIQRMTLARGSSSIALRREGTPRGGGSPALQFTFTTPVHSRTNWVHQSTTPRCATDPSHVDCAPTGPNADIRIWIRVVGNCGEGLDLVHGVDCVVEAEVDEVGEVWLWSRACGGDVGLLQFAGLCTTRVA